MIDLQTLATLPVRLLLLVGPQPARLTRRLHAWRDQLAVPLLDLSLALGERLPDGPTNERAVRVAAILDDLLAGGADPLLMDHVETLFDPALGVDPLALLKRASRHRVLIVAWPGEIDANGLTHATPSQPDYRRYPPTDLDDITVVTLPIPPV
ncbi:MAG: BREX-3 system P-loop-containing protein BrxF [Anaerolineae bacterium]|nr:BREX-3 system P-loop-containing protein BrxF [Anaerolineae bacterium]